MNGSIVAVETEPALKTAFCPQCGRLMADKPGPLCDHCEPQAARAAAVATPLRFHAWVTWSLVAVTTVVSIVALSLMREQFPPGASFGPFVAGGQWWRLITASFVHFSLGHLFWNMIPFIFLGPRLERKLGHWSYLAFYISSGVSGAISSLFVLPELPSAGASGAIFGVCGGLIAHYGPRIGKLSTRQRVQLAALVAYTVYSLWPGRFDSAIDNADHFGGLLAGLVLGIILSARVARPASTRRWIFITAGLLLALAAFTFRERHLYLVHLDLAASAMQNGKTEIAARELHTALAMKPDSPVGQFLLRKMENDRPSDR